MSQIQQIASNIPHESRVKILLEWLPVATADIANPAMYNLFEAWFLFVDPNGIRKENCPICVNNVLQNWRQMAGAMAEAEREYNLINAI